MLFTCAQVNLKLDYSEGDDEQNGGRGTGGGGGTPFSPTGDESMTEGGADCLNLNIDDLNTDDLNIDELPSLEQQPIPPALCPAMPPPVDAKFTVVLQGAEVGWWVGGFAV